MRRIIGYPLRFVLIDCPYDTWDDPRTRELFDQVVSLKLKGYLSAYSYGTLPVDTFDFVGTHHLICWEEGGTLRPVMGYKTTTLERARLHNLPFPVIPILESSGAREHARAALEVINQCTAAGTGISYDGSWTIDPEARRDRELAGHLKRVMTAINALYHLRKGVPQILGFGMLRFKTDLYFKSLGYEELRGSEGPLPPLQMSTLQGEPAMLLHLRSFSPLALETAESLEYLWRDRIEIADPGARERALRAKKAA